MAAITEMNNYKRSRRKIIAAMEILHAHPLFKYRSVSLIANNKNLKHYSTIRLTKKIIGSNMYLTSNDFSKESRLRLQFIKDMNLVRSTYFPVFSYGIFAVSVVNGGKQLDKYLLTFVKLYLSVVVAPVVELAIDNENNFEAAIHDALTGVYNKGYLSLQLKKECSNIRSGGTVSLLMIDLDNFKKLNDTYGHPAGDKVLKAVAKLLLLGLRKYDTVARFGGEEFVIILPDANLDIAKLRAEELRQVVYEFDYGIKEFKTDYKPSISVGVGNIPFNASNETELLEVADKGVYIAKNSGKNKVSVHK